MIQLMEKVIREADHKWLRAVRYLDFLFMMVDNNRDNLSYDPLVAFKKRLEDGERTWELYEEIMTFVF